MRNTVKLVQAEYEGHPVEFLLSNKWVWSEWGNDGSSRVSKCGIDLGRKSARQECIITSASALWWDKPQHFHLPTSIFFQRYRTNETSNRLP
ncbi:hypothetical protein LshimejAT787_0806140 [Lyophyllum shimeji]|uniref:Uncharacterized protein n=1 Tax=Lyophyllum shimeji TaxID=47721 RepID=A0A9P3PSF6_LYOSH|nr:hypothetical protein LshimejAT787_0806140 [Lyophyllum shimeji]